MSTTDATLPSSTVRTRVMGRELVLARERLGLDRAAAAAVLHSPVDWLDAVEDGRLDVDRNTLARLLGAYRADTRTHTRMMDLYGQPETGWLIQPHDIGEADGVDAALLHEATADDLFVYDILSLPVFLRTERYARELLARDGNTTPAEVEQRLAAGLRRYRSFRPSSSSSTRRTFIVHEPTLRHLHGDRQTIKEQLHHLAHLPARAAAVRVIPVSAPASYWEQVAFTLTKTRTHRPVVHVRTVSCTLFLDRPDLVEHYRDMATRLLEHALSRTESHTLLLDLANPA
ncbi:helix-turn-helix domain-containing protein [Saccharothrix lopnurensis]|uniref:Helix-turn-helix domain-containing protein n=1 Tax=Saccharothrix lopnurensis TaxID=1670621 RepID=A0ABW1PFM7_9PSEU